MLLRSDIFRAFGPDSTGAGMLGNKKKKYFTHSSL
jgi:hypothetical protein